MRASIAIVEMTNEPQSVYEFHYCTTPALLSALRWQNPAPGSHTGKTGRDHGTRFGGKQCPLLRSARVSAGLRCIFITDSVQTVVRHLESVQSPRFSRHCTVRTPCITVRTPFIRLQTPYGLRVFYVRAPCVCLRRPNGLSYLWFRRCPLLPVFSRLLLAPSLPNNG